MGSRNLHVVPRGKVERIYSFRKRSKFSNFHATVFPLVLSTRCLSNPATVHLGPRSVKASGVTLSRGVGRGVKRETARGIEWGALPSPCTIR